MQVVELNCSGCGGALAIDMVECKYCGRAVVISSFNTLSQLNPLQLKAAAKSFEQGNCVSAVGDGQDGGNVNFALGCCYLKLALYDKAIEKFEMAIDEEYGNSETYFYAAASLLKGKKAFLTPLQSIKKIIEYVEAAIMLDGKGIYHYFLAYVKHDFYARKCLKISPSWSDELATAYSIGVTASDVIELFKLLKVEIPDCLS